MYKVNTQLQNENDYKDIESNVRYYAKTKNLNVLKISENNCINLHTFDEKILNLKQIYITNILISCKTKFNNICIEADKKLIYTNKFKNTLLFNAQFKQKTTLTINNKLSICNIHITTKKNSINKEIYILYDFINAGDNYVNICNVNPYVYYLTIKQCEFIYMDICTNPYLNKKLNKEYTNITEFIKSLNLDFIESRQNVSRDKNSYNNNKINITDIINIELKKQLKENEQNQTSLFYGIILNLYNDLNWVEINANGTCVYKNSINCNKKIHCLQLITPISCDLNINLECSHIDANMFILYKTINLQNNLDHCSSNNLTQQIYETGYFSTLIPHINFNY